MILQLMGRMDPGESFAYVNVPENILPDKIFSLELVSINFCNQAEHADTHFPVVQTSEFPREPDYNEIIEIAVP